jgi:surface carbohydrate biosynthesis protein
VGWPSRIYPGTEEFIDKYLCVGPKTYRAALIRFSDTPEKVSLTGWPRVDIWRKLGFSIYKEEIELIRKKHGSYLLFVSDFGLNEDENIYIEGLKCVSPTDLNFQKTLKSIRQWDLNPEIPKIVIRPHITEDKRLWKKVLGEASKTEIHKEFNVTPWVLASAGIIHRGSTVALEAKLAGKDVFFLKESSKNERNLFSDLLSDALVHIDFEGAFPKIEESKSSIPSALRDYVLIEEFDAVSRVVA